MTAPKIVYTDRGLTVLWGAWAGATFLGWYDTPEQAKEAADNAR